MLYKKSQVTASAKKLEKMLNSLPDLTKSSRLLKIQHQKCKLSIQTFEDDINSLMNSKEPVFNRTKNYKDQKLKVNIIRNLEIQRQKENQKKIAELFAHSSKNSEFIHPDMLKDQTVKKVLRGNKRSFGGVGDDEGKFVLPEIQLSTKNLLGSKMANKNLKKILYNNTYRNSLYCKNNQMFKNIEIKKPESQVTSPKYEEKGSSIVQDENVDQELNERIKKSVLEYGELKLKLARCLIYKVKKF